MQDPQFQTPDGRFDHIKGLAQLQSEGTIHNPDTIPNLQIHFENLDKSHAEANKNFQEAANFKSRADERDRKGQQAITDSLANFALDMKEQGIDPGTLDGALIWFENNHPASKSAAASHARNEAGNIPLILPIYLSKRSMRSRSSRTSINHPGGNEAMTRM